MMHSLSVGCGSYDGSVYVLQYVHDDKLNDGPRLLRPTFVDTTAHSGPVNSLAIREGVMVSGSSDEVIQVFCLRSGTRLGSLELHSGTIRHLVFAADSNVSKQIHLLSASDDGCIAVWRGAISEDSSCNKPWECIRSFHRHKGPVTGLSLHPSSRYALSISEDHTFRIWNLVRGRQAYVKRTKSFLNGALRVALSPSGNRVLFIWPNRFDIMDLTNSSIDNSDSMADKHHICTRLGSVHLEQSISADPVFYTEDDSDVDCDQHHDTEKYLHVLSGSGQLLQAFRFQLSPPTGAKDILGESVGEIKLPGRRVKFIRVLPWPKQLQQEVNYGWRCRLVVTATTESYGTYLRGYSVNLASHDSLIHGQSMMPLFVYDVMSSRITAMDSCWSEDNEQNTCTEDEPSPA